MTDQGAAFRRLHEEPGAFFLPNAWDIASARIMTAMGFRAIGTTSLGMAVAQGVPDDQMPREAKLLQCQSIVTATDLPVTGDLERGLGDSPESAAETVRVAGAIGLAGGSLEDHTGHPDDPIYPFAEAVDRVAAAAEACRFLPRDFVLTARSDNFLWGREDLDDTIRRLLAFEAAGADVLYAPGVRDIGMVREICAAVRKPVCAMIGAPGAAFTLADLVGAGVKRITGGSALARLAYGSIVEALREVQTEGTFSRAEGAMPSEKLEVYLKDRHCP